jgi:hypothetical protein
MPVIEIVCSLAFLVHIYKTVRMFLEEPGARPVATREERAPAAEPQDAGLDDHDRHGLWLVAFPRDPRQAFRFSARPR